MLQTRFMLQFILALLAAVHVPSFLTEYFFEISLELFLVPYEGQFS